MLFRLRSCQQVNKICQYRFLASRCFSLRLCSFCSFVLSPSAVGVSFLSFQLSFSSASAFIFSFSSILEVPSYTYFGDGQDVVALASNRQSKRANKRNPRVGSDTRAKVSKSELFEAKEGSQPLPCPPRTNLDHSSFLSSSPRPARFAHTIILASESNSSIQSHPIRSVPIKGQREAGTRNFALFRLCCSAHLASNGRGGVHSRHFLEPELNLAGTNN